MPSIWDQLVDAIVRPPRDVYNIGQLYGGSNGVFLVQNMESCRCDFELVNKKGQKLQCSHYLPLGVQGKDGKLPCVVYCHCNSGSRRDAEEAVWHLLPSGIGVVAFDFAGSGLSDGQWVTLGAHEVDDLEVVVNHLRHSGAVSSIGLWGRSMGAVTALMYSCRDPQVAGIVLDSPFSRLNDLMLEIVEQQNLPIPKVMLRLALGMMRKSVKKKAGFDITGVAPIDLVPQSAIPAMFGHGKDDSFIAASHSEKLQAAYGSAVGTQYKNLVLFEGDHNHPRPAFFYASVAIFFHTQLHLDDQLVGGNPAAAMALQALAEPHSRANGSSSLPWELGRLGSGSVDSRPSSGAAAAQAGSAGTAPRQASLTAADWGFELADGSDDDAALAAAIEASLCGAPVQPSRASAGRTAATARTALSTSTVPGSLEEEEEMLRKALALSLADAPGRTSCSDGGASASSLCDSLHLSSGSGSSNSAASSSGGANAQSRHARLPPAGNAPGKSVHVPVPGTGPPAGSSHGKTAADVHAGAEAGAVQKGLLAPAEQLLATSPGIGAYHVPSPHQQR